MSSMDSMDSSDGPKHTVIRVKRRADEEKSLSHKRCKFVGTTDSADHKHIYHLLDSTQALPQRAAEENRLKICDYEDVCDSEVFGFKSNDIITCNGEPLESVESQLNESLDYLYDIYVYDDKESPEVENPNEYRECEDEDEDSNDENYAYNDYPDECDDSEDVIDYFSYGDKENESQSDLRNAFHTNTISSDYESNSEDEDQIQRYYRKKAALDESNEEEEEEY